MASNPQAYDDLDAFFDEHEHATRPVKLLGKVRQLPADVPAAPMLKIQRLFSVLDELGDDDTVPDDLDPDDVRPDRLLVDLIGQPMFDELVADGLRVRQMGTLAGMLYRHYTNGSPLVPPSPAGDGDAPAGDEVEEGKASTSSGSSSPGGGSSKRTGKRSTTKTSATS